MNPRNQIPFILLLAFSAWSTLLAQGGNPRFKIEADVIGGLSGESNSTRFSNFGVNEPISGLSLKDLPDIKNFAGFVGKIVPLDQDMDGLPDHQEIALGTDKTKPDTDGDGLTDKEEVELGTDPLKTDTDGDGYSDLAEVNASTNPKDAQSNPNQNPVFASITDLSIRENKPTGSTVGTLQANDADGDILTFSLLSISGNTDREYFTLQSDGVLKTKVSFDYELKNKYVLKAEVSDSRGGVAVMEFEVLITNNILDDPEVVGMMDDDNDGLSNSSENELGTNPNKADSDGDGLSDRDEIIWGSNPLQPDTDADGLSDQEEYTLGSDPNQKDTDGDGYDDKAENIAGTLLEDRFDYPGSEDERNDLNTKTDSPNGLLYHIHFAKRGWPWVSAQALEKRLQGNIPELSADDTELKNYLVNLMVKEQVEAKSRTSGLVGAWVRSKDNPEALSMITLDGKLSENEILANDRLAIILSYKLPEIYAPVIQSFTEKKSGDSFQVEAAIQDNGGEEPFRYGFEITETLLVSDTSSKRIVSGNKIAGTPKFIATIDRLTPGITYYVRPFAENSSGLTTGNFTRIRIEPEIKALFDAVASGEDKWMTSSWFGSYHRANDNWIYHAGLKWWIYAANEEGFGQWFWTEELGWCWTAKAIHPFIWTDHSNTWLYQMDNQRNGKTIFWNYGNSKAELY
jgi:hypothetical protein